MKPQGEFNLDRKIRGNTVTIHWKLWPDENPPELGVNIWLRGGEQHTYGGFVLTSELSEDYLKAALANLYQTCGDMIPEIEQARDEIERLLLQNAAD